MRSFFKNIHMPHVFALLTLIILICSLLTYVIPSGSFERNTVKIDGRDRTLIVPGSYKPSEKEITFKSVFLGGISETKANPVSVTGFVSAIPRGLQESADIVFFIFILGGVFGILQKTGTIIALLQAMMNRFKNSAPLLTFFIMAAVAIAGSTLGMGEEFIPLVPIFIILAVRLGYDPIYGLSMIMLAADMGFAAATINPFTVGIASGIAEVPLGSDFGFRLIFFSIIFIITFIYVLRYGAMIKKDPSKSLMKDYPYAVSDVKQEEVPVLTRQHILVMTVSFLIFAFIIYAIESYGWWFNEMAGGFFLMAICAVIITRMKLKEASNAFVKGMEEMVVAALVVGFARGIVVVLMDGQILDTIIYGAANLLQNFHDVIAAQGMLVFQTMLNFFIPSGSGQAAVTMPLMAPLSDVLGISRITAIFAFTCGDGFSNTIVPTSGILMAMLSLAKIPYQVWLKYVLPLFGILMVISAIFLTISVFIHN